MGDQFTVRGGRPAVRTSGADSTAQPAAPTTRSHVDVLKGEIAKLDKQSTGWGQASKDARALRNDLAAELGLVQQAQAGQIKLPAQTQAYVGPLTQKLTGEEKAIVLAKAAELSQGGYGVEQTSGPRFAANLAMELSEYMAMGARPSAAMNEVVQKTVQDGMSVFREKPPLMSEFQANLNKGKANALARDP